MSRSMFIKKPQQELRKELRKQLRKELYEEFGARLVVSFTVSLERGEQKT